MPKTSILIAVSVLLLSLAVWVFFFEMNWTLQPAETAVVVGISLLIVFGAKWVVSEIRNHRRKTNS